jgi:hypothetical protein
MHGKREAAAAFALSLACISLAFIPFTSMAQSASQAPASLPTSIEFAVVQTRNLTSEQFLLGQSGGTETTIAGELRIPATKASKFPAVILMHGGGGDLTMEEWTFGRIY